MRKIIITSVVLAGGIGGSATTAPAAPSASRAVLHHFHGTVSSVDRSHRTFRLHTNAGPLVRFRVTRATRFERTGGFAGLHRGLRVQVDARHQNGVWNAVKVERPRGGGGGGDDGPGHT